MSSVLIFAMDGLQPSQVTFELMPNLTAFASTGVFFENHHPVYPSVTRVNAASIMTGCYPGTHGLVGNTLVIREYDPRLAFSALVPELTKVIQKTGRLLLRPTLAEILAAHHKKFVSVGTGSSGNSFVHNPHLSSDSGQTIHPEFTIPANLASLVTSKFGDWLERTQPDHTRNEYAVRVLTEYALDDQELAIYWCDEPDLTQHAAGVNSEQGKEALAIADRTFGKVIEWLDKHGQLNETDVMVVSDHGYSTSQGVIDVHSLVNGAGFAPVDGPGGVITAENGGSVFFWVNDSLTPAVDRLAEWLTRQPWCAAITVPDMHGGIEGALPARIVGLQGERAPDLTMSFTWNSDPNEGGVPGHFYSTGKGKGLGDHGSLSKHEMRNTLIASGPSFKDGVRIHTPTGNVDLAPTTLKILGLPGGDSMEGRRLEEALVDGPEPDSIPVTTNVHEAERKIDDGGYRQQITVSQVRETTYVDQGLGDRFVTA